MGNGTPREFFTGSSALEDPSAFPRLEFAVFGFRACGGVGRERPPFAEIFGEQAERIVNGDVDVNALANRLELLVVVLHVCSPWLRNQRRWRARRATWNRSGCGARPGFWGSNGSSGGFLGAVRRPGRPI